MLYGKGVNASPYIGSFARQCFSLALLLVGLQPLIFVERTTHPMKVLCIRSYSLKRKIVRASDDQESQAQNSPQNQPSTSSSDEKNSEAV